MTATHKCSEHLQFVSIESVEPHGERHTDEGYKCLVCGEIYDVDDPPQDEGSEPEDERAGSDPDDIESWLDEGKIPPATESRFTVDGYYRRQIGYDESRADELIDDGYFVSVVEAGGWTLAIVEAAV